MDIVYPALIAAVLVVTSIFLYETRHHGWPWTERREWTEALAPENWPEHALRRLMYSMDAFYEVVFDWDWPEFPAKKIDLILKRKRITVIIRGDATGLMKALGAAADMARAVQRVGMIAKSVSPLKSNA